MSWYEDSDLRVPKRVWISKGHYSNLIVTANARVERAAAQPKQAPQAPQLSGRLRRPPPNFSRAAPTHG